MKHPKKIDPEELLRQPYNPIRNEEDGCAWLIFFAAGWAGVILIILVLLFNTAPL